ncbi:MAG: amidohydrolase family protein, partial [Candidatus Binatia bacterium]
MYKGYKIIDMDTHVGPATEVLEKYVEPSFRTRLSELERYKRVRIQEVDGVKTKKGTVITVAPITYDRFPGTAPKADDLKSEAGGRGAIEGRTQAQRRGPIRPGVDQENSQGRLEDMDLEGRDIDFMFPSDWAATITALEDVTLAEGLWRAYHRYLCEYTAIAPDRLKACLQVPGADPKWAVSEIKMWGKEKWVAAVWVQLKEGLPVDHPDLEPIWATMNELDLPLVHHSFFYEPPYFP